MAQYFRRINHECININVKCCDYNQQVRKQTIIIHITYTKTYIKLIQCSNNNTKKNDTSINNHYECKCGKDI